MGKGIIRIADATDETFPLEPGPPVTCAPDSLAFVLASGRAELFLRTGVAQSFLGTVEAGEAVFPEAPEGAGFLLVMLAPGELRPLADDEQSASAAHWRERLERFGISGHPEIAKLNASLVDAFEARAADRDRAELERLQGLAKQAGANTPPTALADLLGRCADALKVPRPGIHPGESDHDFDDIPRLAQRFGLSARRLTLTGSWAYSDQGPLLLRSAETGEALLALWQRGGYRVAGGPKLSPADHAAFDRRAFAVSAPLPTGITGFTSLAKHVLRQNFDELRTIAIAATFMALIGALVPLATGWLLNDIAPSGDVGLLVAVGVALLFAGLVTYLLSTVRGMATSRLEGKTSTRLSTGVLDRILRLPAGFFREHTAGDLNQRISGVDAIRGLVLSIALSAGLSAILSIFYFAVLAYYGLALALIAVALVSVYIGIVAATRIIQMPLIRQAYAVDGQLAEQGYEMIGAVAKLRSAAAERRALARWASRYGEERQLELRAGVINAYSAAASDSWQVLTQVILFGGVAWLTQSSLPPGSFIAFLAAFGAFQGAFVALSSQMIELYAAQPQLERARPILLAQPEISEQRRDPGPLTGAIEVDNVSFGYDESLPPVLSGISLSIPAGQHVAIVGGSGSGKSTLLRLLLGFESPRGGTICYDGKDMAELDLSLLRAQCGVVLQSSSLFAGSIIDNIRGPHSAGLEQCLAAAAQAGLASDLESFPMGIHTPITEGAAVLSGGQRQRILIARALVGGPRILFFDEATSALDNQSQAMVAQTLDRMQATRITIAHRLSTIEHADRICVIANGRIAEQGSYAELMAAGGTFAALARRQLMEE